MPRHPPRAIVLRLRHANGKPLRGATVDGDHRAVVSAPDSSICVKPGRGLITVRAELGTPFTSQASPGG